MFDTHVHTKHSADGKSGMGEYASLMEKGVVEGIGFSDHLEFMPICGSYGWLCHDLYIKDINILREKGYSVYAGAEVDYAKIVERDIIECLKRDRYDYIIGSVHMVDDVTVSDRGNIDDFYDSIFFRKVLEGYYREVKSSLKVKEFDVIGHIGVYARYFEQSFIDNHVYSAWIKEVNAELARECALSGKIIEVNTSGLFAKKASTVPGVDFLSMYYGFGGRKVSIGSDAHCAKDVGRGFKSALDMLLRIGFEYYYLPWRKDEPVKLKMF